MARIAAVYPPAAWKMMNPKLVDARYPELLAEPEAGHGVRRRRRSAG